MHQAQEAQFSQFATSFQRVKTGFQFMGEQLLPEFVNSFRRVKTDFQFLGEQLLPERVARFTAKTNMFLQGFEFALGAQKRLELHNAVRFNIFGILKVGHLEAKVHSPFLAELLNPSGSHGQGPLFLQSFLHDVLGMDKKAEGTGDWIVRTEAEQVDIRLENPVSRQAVFIENKIYTGAHSGQLTKYFQIWKNGFSKGVGAFIYLSIDGSPPANEGFDPLAVGEYSQEEIELQLVCLSYKTDIANWLENRLPYVKAHKVKVIINQYLDIIINL